MSIIEQFHLVGAVAAGLYKEGRAEELGMTAADVDPEQLKIGIKVELEHTDDKKKAKQVALDHLAEFKDYYTALTDMEEELSESGSAVEEKDSSGAPPTAAPEGAGAGAVNTKPDISNPRITR